MISPAVSPFGVALLLAVSVLAILLAPTVFSPPGADAHPCDEGPAGHVDFHGIGCDAPGHDRPHENVIEADGGRDNELVFRVYPPSVAGYLDVDDQIEIKLTEFSFPDRELIDTTKVKISGSEDDPKSDAAAMPSTAAIDGDTLILTNPALAGKIGVGEHLIITIEEGTGILAPELPKGFPDPTQKPQDKGYPIEITFIDSNNNGLPERPAMDENFVVVKNPVSSTVPGETVRLELATYASAAIGSNEEITVDFSGPSDDTGFILPTSIATSRVKIRHPMGNSAVSFDPADVLVQGERVFLTIPDNQTVPEGEFTISFNQFARIKNPYSAGNVAITVSSFVPGFLDDEITAIIRRTTTIEPEEGTRGSEFTLEGKGYAPGTVTIFEGSDRIIDAGETLAAVKTVRGAFAAKLIALGKYGDLVYRVNTKDSNGVHDDADFSIESSIEFQPAAATIGSTLRMTIYDWENLNKKVAAVRIAGERAYPRPLTAFEECFDSAPPLSADTEERMIRLSVVVPRRVPPGEQTVAVYGSEHLENCDSQGSRVRFKGNVVPLAAATIGISSDSLTLSPSMAARGQRITISGSGFARASGGEDDFYSVSVNGQEVAQNLSQFEVGTNGNFTLTATVPLEARAGANEVRVVGWDGTIGQAILTVPEPAIALDPPRSGRGTEVSITGTGFIVQRVVTLSYGDGVDPEAGDDIVGVAVADGEGRILGSFTVPYEAAVGRTHKVTARLAASGESRSFDIKAEADHVPVGAAVTTKPAGVPYGDHLTIRGENFPAFTLLTVVEIGGVGVYPRTETSTDEDGAFEASVLVPQLMLGDHVLKVRVGNEIVIGAVRIVPPPLSGPISQVFKVPIETGVLGRIWHLDRPTQKWSFFDPSPEFRGHNNLNSVNRGDILWVDVSEPIDFQGTRLTAGWNLIRLK